MLSDGGLKSRGGRTDEDVDLTAYATTTDLVNYTATALSNYATTADVSAAVSGLATTADVSGKASLSANNTFTGTQTLNNGITVNHTTLSNTTFKFEVNDYGSTVDGSFKVKSGTENLLTLYPTKPNVPGSATIGPNVYVTNLISSGSLSATGTISTTGNVVGSKLLATGAFTATSRGSLGGGGSSHGYLNGVEPVLHVMHDSVYNVGRWIARATDGTFGWLSGVWGITYLPSDDRLKYNEVPITGAIQHLKALQPRHYTKKRSLIDADDGGVEEYGFIAQDVESIEGLECLVFEDMDCKDPDLRVKHVNYHGLTTISVQALKELITTVEDLQMRLAAVELASGLGFTQ